MSESKLYCHVKRAANRESAINMAQELVHPSKWKFEGRGTPGQLAAFHAMRNRNGNYDALQRSGYWKVEFYPI